MNDQEDILTETIQEASARRIKLIPLWIKIFAWIFLVFSCIAPIIIILGIMGRSAELSLYGFETQEPFSIVGISIILVFILKGFVSLGILKEKKWAVKLGLTDAIIGIIACVFTMVYPLFSEDGFHLSFRLELIALVPFLIKLDKIKKQWEGYYLE